MIVHDLINIEFIDQQDRVNDTMNLPSVSIVVPVFNGERTIRACIESLLSLDYPFELMEVIIVDNRSSDRTHEIALKYPIQLLSEVSVQSSYASRNRGIEVAKGEIVAFTDADCIANRDWLQELVAPFEDQAVGGVGGKVLDSQPENDIERFICSLEIFSNHQNDNTFLPMTLTNNTAYRHEHLIKLGLFNERLFTGGDIELCWRLQLNLGIKIAYATKAIVYHVHRSSLTSMARQFRRHGYGEIFIDAMFKDQPGYKRTPRKQFLRMIYQSLALITYLRSIVYRGFSWKIQKKDKLYAKSPFYHLVAESNNLWGKILGLKDTRFFTINPANYQWQESRKR